MSKAPKRSLRFIAYRDMEEWDRQDRATRAGRITLAVIKPADDRMKVLRGKQRREVASAVRAVMKDWQSTPFESEGTIIAGLRSSLCLTGHGWKLSDGDARALVADCLDAIGAVRPRHEEGQREYTIRPDQCAWCHGPIPDELDVGQHSHRYCSDVCARAALQHRDFRERKTTDASYAAAMAIVRRVKMPVIACQECEKPFHPTALGAKYCSPDCEARGRSKVLRKLPDRSCAKCHQTFRVLSYREKYCGAACAYAGRSDFRDTRECGCCGKTYEAKSPVAKFCSTSCGNLVRHFRTPEFRPKGLSPRVFDYVLKQAGARITDVSCIGS